MYKIFLEYIHVYIARILEIPESRIYSRVSIQISFIYRVEIFAKPSKDPSKWLTRYTSCGCRIAKLSGWYSPLLSAGLEKNVINAEYGYVTLDEPVIELNYFNENVWDDFEVARVLAIRLFMRERNAYSISLGTR